MHRLQLTTVLVGCLALLTHSSAQNKCVIGTNFTRPSWKAQDDMFKNYHDVSGDNPWNPQFLSDCTIYRCVRTMDADETNRSMREQWMDRPQKSNREQSPIAYEWFIDICNRLDADLWVCIPHRTTSRTSGDLPNDYALRLAILIKTGVDVKTIDLGDLSRIGTKSAQDFISMGGVRTSAPLKENLKFYIEYSNETWNDSFKRSDTKEGQYTWCIEEGSALSLGNRPGARFHAWAALRAFRAVELVFGTNSPRIVKVLAGKIGAPTDFDEQKSILTSPTHNPWQITHNALAIAPYIGHKATTIEELQADIAIVTPQTQFMRRKATRQGVKLLAYEAGQHVTTNHIAINNLPQMYAVYTEYLDSIAPSFDLLMHFSQVGVWGTSGAWGAKQSTSKSLAQSHKYRALVDWIANNPVQASFRIRNARSPKTAQTQARHLYLLNGTRLDSRAQSSLATQLHILQNTDGSTWTQSITPAKQTR